MQTKVRLPHYDFVEDSGYSNALDYVQPTQELVRRKKKFLYQGLSHLDVSYVETQANFLLLTHLPRALQAIKEGMRRRGVIIRPMGGFGLPDAIRVTVGTHALAQILESRKMTSCTGPTTLVLPELRGRR